MEALDSFCKQVRFPKEIVIENRRLGWLFRILQVAIAFYIGFTVIWGQQWIDESAPTIAFVEFWMERRVAYTNALNTVKHCTDLAAFRYVFSSTFTYEPASCQPLPSREAMLKMSSNTIFFPTYISDTFYDTNSDAVAKAEFFPRNIEEQSIIWFHRYTARDLTQQFEGGAVSQMKVSPYGKCLKGVDPKEVEGDEGKLLTVIKKTDCDDCKVGGKSAWSEKDSSAGIAGTLKEWLSCAGVDLDDSAGLPKSGNEGEVGSASYRVAGLELILEIQYKNAGRHNVEYGGEKWPGMVAEVRPKVVPKWNSQPVSGYAVVPSYVSFTGGTFSGGHNRYRYQYGITTTIVAAGGAFSFFNLQKFQTAIVTALVFLGIPISIVRIIALNLIGPISEVYKNLQAQNVFLNDETTSVLMKMVCYMNAFKSIAENSGDPNHIEAKDMSDVLYKGLEHIEDLSKGEIDNLALIVMQGLDVKNTNSVDMEEFVDAVLKTEAVQPSTLGKLFDAERVPCITEKLFTDGIMRKRLQVRQSYASRSGMDLTPVAAPAAEENKETKDTE